MLTFIKDIPDHEGDEKFGIQSLSVHLGQKRVVLLTYNLRRLGFALLYPWFTINKFLSGILDLCFTSWNDLCCCHSCGCNNIFLPLEQNDHGDFLITCINYATVMVGFHYIKVSRFCTYKLSKFSYSMQSQRVLLLNWCIYIYGVHTLKSKRESKSYIE